MSLTAFALARLIADLQPAPAAEALARTRIAGVRGALSRHLPTPVLRYINAGSFEKATNIKGRSDVDLLFVVDTNSIRWGGRRITSEALLERFRRALVVTYPTTDIGRDGQAVAVRFYGAATLDIVPAIPAGQIRGANIYKIPDGSRGWMTTAPLVEITRFRRANARSGRKLGRTLQLLKWWRVCRAERVHIRSFYMELVLTASNTCAGPKPYSQILRDSFRALCNRGGAAMRDPDGRVGLTHIAPPRASPYRVLERLRQARHQATLVHYYASKGQHGAALTHLGRLFNGRLRV